MAAELEPIEVNPAITNQASLNDALGALHGGSDTVQGLTFPSNLEKHFLMFKVKKRERQTQKIAAGSQIKNVISLPIPANLSTGYNAKYANAPIGPGGALAQAVAAGDTSSLSSVVDSMNGGEEGGGLLGAIKNVGAGVAENQLAAIVGGVAGGALSKGGTLGSAVGAALGDLAGDALTGTLQSAGVARNPHLAVLFEGVDMRTHQFQYKLIARNAAESSTLREIITQFKLAMAPEFSEANHFFNYPDEFDIEFSKPLFLFKIGTSVLVDFQVNYTAQDGSLFHSNRAPLAVSISMTFQELDIITKAEIKEGR